MENLQLEDLIAFYPESDDPNFQAIISAKKEYQELASLPNENIPELSGELFNHQKFFGRLMRHVDAGLVMDKPGTGKTCKVVTAMEYFQRNRGIIRNFYVIVPNKAVKHDAMRQIICGCNTGERYRTKGLSAATIQGQRIAAAKGISKYYKVFTHGEFARYISDKYPDRDQLIENIVLNKQLEEVEEGKRKVSKYRGISEKILKKYTDWKTTGVKGGPKKGKDLDNFIMRIYYQNSEDYEKDFPLTEEQIKTQVNEYQDLLVTEMSGSFFYLDEGHLLVPKTGSKDDLENLKETLKNKYIRQIGRVFHSVKRSKKVITTATPMSDEPKDIKPIVDLLRPKDHPVPEDFDYIRSSLDEVNRYFGGMITYVAPVDNKVDVYKEGQEISYGGLRFIAYILNMSEHQEKHYNKYVVKEVTGAFKSNSLQASMFVFPDGSVGHKGLKKYATRAQAEKKLELETEEQHKAKKSSTARWWSLGAEMRKDIRKDKLGAISKYSVKCAEAIKLALEDEEGVIYINMPFVEGGAIPWALCFEAMGFEVFTSNKSVFETMESKTRDYCRSESSTVKLKSNFVAKNRIAVYSSDLVFPDTVNESALELINSKENVNGKYIKVVIVTPVGKVGISINNVSKIITTTSDWNETNNIQKEFRAIRATSHIARIKQLERLEEEELGFLTQEARDQIRIALPIYRMAAVSSEGNSTDLEVYSKALNKEIPIQIFTRKLLQVANDCNLNKARNTMLDKQGKPRYEEGSLECNFQSCTYQCYQQASEETDFSTYDIYYLGEVLENIIDKIIPVLRRYGSLSYNELSQKLPDIPQKHIVIALAELINNKRGIKDRFGFTVYVAEDSGQIYLNRELNVNEYALSYYSKNLITINTSTMDDIFEHLNGDIASRTLQDLKELGLNTKKFREALEDLPLSLKAELLEMAITSLEEKIRETGEDIEEVEDAEEYKVIRDFFAEQWYRVPEPIDYIEEERRKVLEKDNRGRPATREKKKNRVSRMTDEVEIDDIGTEDVYFHIIFTEQESQTKHGKIARALKAEGKYRIFRPAYENEWRDMDQFELAAYNLVVQSERIKKEKEKRDNLDVPIYGRINKEGVLWIVDKTKEREEVNGQTVYRGKIANTWSKIELIPILYELEIMPPNLKEDDDIVSVNKKGIIRLRDRDEAESVIRRDFSKFRFNKNITTEDAVEEWDDRKVALFYKWLLIMPIRSYYKGPFCNQIKEAMIEQDRIIYF